jgi:hypothetical protein
MIMPIENIPRELSIADDIKPVLVRAGFKVKWIDGEYLRGVWVINKQTSLLDEPSRFRPPDIKLRGPDAMQAARVIEKEFPMLNIQVTETERPKPGLLSRLWDSIFKAEEFI